jgi:hypothetical protein
MSIRQPWLKTSNNSEEMYRTRRSNITYDRLMSNSPASVRPQLYDSMVCTHWLCIGRKNKKKHDMTDMRAHLFSYREKRFQHPGDLIPPVKRKGFSSRIINIGINGKLDVSQFAETQYSINTISQRFIIMSNFT